MGVEHASFEDLEKALAGLVGSYEDEHFFDITKSDLMRLGLLMYDLIAFNGGLPQR